MDALEVLLPSLPGWIKLVSTLNKAPSRFPAQGAWETIGGRFGWLAAATPAGPFVSRRGVYGNM